MNPDRVIEVSAREKIDEIEKLLSLAEELKDRYDNLIQRIIFHRTIQSIMAVLGVAALLSLYLLKNTLDKPFATVVFYFLIIFSISEFVLTLYFESLIRRLKRQTYPDLKAISEIVALLREIEGTEDWSALERAQFRIRLSRFDIDS